MQFTRAQQEAIDTMDHNLQIIACAGSGKTSVVAARVINILEKKAGDGIVPENILAFTFTDKAAAELKDRITRLYRETFGSSTGIAGMYVGTIHSFCMELLQQHVYDYLKCDVLDEVTQRLLVDRYYRQCGMKGLGLRRWVQSYLYITALRMIREAEVDHALLKNTPIADGYAAYSELLDRLGYLDFDELQVRAVGELRGNEELREVLADRIKYVIVDEYQDLSPIQELIVEELHGLGANICVVGDDDQNIYQWRGSDVQFILDFQEKYPDVVAKRLEKNFRSSPAIVEVARRAVEVNERRLPKEMVSTDAQQFARGDLLCLGFDDPDEEAAWIAQKIEDMRGLPFGEHDGRERGLSWSDFAVLLRVRKCANTIVDALREADIPYVVAGMSGLFDTEEAQAASGIFQFMAGLIDADELRNLWDDANCGLDPSKLDAGIEMLAERSDFAPKTAYSVYALQRTFLDFLAEIELREEEIPGDRGEVVFFNLGKFSQVISDYEEIHFKSDPAEKYESFVKFLHYQAPDAYPEGGQDVSYAVPDAVQVMTVHQAKGLEFPVVFLPCMQRNRFPGVNKKSQVWKHLPREAIVNADRYDGSEEDERRLFYVAITRSEKYLFATWAPDPETKRWYKKSSPFWDELTKRDQVLTRDPGISDAGRLGPEPRRPLVNVELSFSDLKIFFECPYQFKLRLLYGFNPPIHEALGYGRSLHNVLAEIHKRAIVGEAADDFDVPELVERHLHLKYAYPKLEETLHDAAIRSVDQYLDDHGDRLDQLEYAEEAVELTLPEGILVRGRVDLIRRLDTDETVIVDFKSTERAQAEDVTRLQLHLYALGYHERFGQNADLIEVHNLDEGGSDREMVDQKMIERTLETVVDAGERLRENRLERHDDFCGCCEQCDVAGLCRSLQ